MKSAGCPHWLLEGQVRAFCALLIAAVLLANPLAAQVAQEEGGEVATPIPIAAEPGTDGAAADNGSKASPEQTDALISKRLVTIFDQVDGLGNVQVRTQAGVVTLAGKVANEQQANDAIALAEQIENVVLVRDKITRSLDLEGNVSPVLEQLSDNLDGWITALPLLGFAFLVFLAIALAGHFLARWSGFWQRLLPNAFLAELIAQAIRIIAIVLGLVVALTLIGATAVLGTILGGAGIAGIAIGFAVRDTLENYVSSIMLSLRQPFRADDHVVINEHEGNVVRLTSRATILMTLDGNHLRIPNSIVFKGIILNYTRNPERRFDFNLGIDAEDDPARGMATGLEAMKALPFLLDEPAPFATIEEVGDSNIVLRFYGWIDQRASDYPKSRSLAIRAAKDRLEETGFTLPEPIYRLRFDQGSALPLASATLGPDTKAEAYKGNSAPRRKAVPPAAEPDLDTQPDTHLLEKAANERSASSERDLLDESRPIE